MDDGFDRRKLSETTESRRYIPEVLVTIYYLATGDGPDAKPLIPMRATSGSTGLDLRASHYSMLYRGVTKVGTGVSLHVKAPRGVQSLDIQVRGRSGLAAKGILVHPGTIDIDYRGELAALMFNVGDERPYEVKAGERIAQLIIPAFARNYDGPIPVPVNVEYAFGKAPVDTERGEGGYGSTGR